MLNKIFLDMDGVLCDFNKKVESLNAFKPDGKVNWDILYNIGSEVWSNMEWVPEGKILYNYVIHFCKKHNIIPAILSAIRFDCGKIGKMEWLKNNCPDIKSENIIIVNNGLEKHKYAEHTSLLIDDNKEFCAKYSKKGPVSFFEKNLFHNYYEIIYNYYKV